MPGYKGLILGFVLMFFATAAYHQIFEDGRSLLHSVAADTPKPHGKLKWKGSIDDTEALGKLFRTQSFVLESNVFAGKQCLSPARANPKSDTTAFNCAAFTENMKLYKATMIMSLTDDLERRFKERGEEIPDKLRKNIELKKELEITLAEVNEIYN